MVAKVTSNNSLFGTLLYNKNKLEKEDAKLLMTKNMFESADGKFSMKLAMKSFEPYLITNKRTENVVFHASLNPNPKDNLSDEQLSGIAEKYLEKLGYSNQPYLIFKHTDIDRTHLHLVTIRVDETGKKIDSSFEIKRSMKICKELEQEYNLHPAIKGQKAESSEMLLKKLNYKEGDIKKQIGNIAKTMVNNFSFQSIGEFRTLLEICNVFVEEVKGEYNGKRYQGLLYSPLDEQGKRVGVPIKASKFGKVLGYDLLLQHFEKSKKNIEKNKTREYLRPIISKALQESHSLGQFKKLLSANSVGVVFRHNDQGRLYGVTFIDYKNKAILNGSRLGKEFSANVINDLFKGKVIDKNEQNINSSQCEQLDFNLGFSLFEQHGVDLEKEEFVRKKVVEERRRRGRGM